MPLRGLRAKPLKRCRSCPTGRRLRRRVKELAEENRLLRLELKRLRDTFYKSKRSKEDEEKEPKKRGAPVGHPGKTRPKPERIDEDIEVTLERCPHCNSTALSRCCRFDDHIQEDTVLPQVWVTRYRHHRYWCQNCKQVVTGVGRGEIPGSYIGPTAKSLAGVLHYNIGVSYRKIRYLFREFFHLSLDPSSLPGFDNQLSRRAGTLYSELKAKLPRAHYLHVDETGWPFDGENYWLWCFANGTMVYYHIDKSRGSKVVKAQLGETFPGTMITDFYSAYNKLPAKAKQQCCLVHLLRTLDKLSGSFPRDKQVRKFCKGLVKLTKQIRELHRNVPSIRKVDLVTRRALLNSRLKTLLKKPLRQPKAEKFRRKLLCCRDQLLICLYHPEIPPDNNFVERQLRPNVILRKITFGNRSPKGTFNHAVIMSLTHTARLNGKSPVEVIKNIFCNRRYVLSDILAPP